MANLKWKPILARAVEIVESYDIDVTLRQLHYRLVSEALIPNTRSAYTTLSQKTAKLRRIGAFPQLFDRTRQIYQYRSFAGADQAQSWLRDIFRLDRTDGQPWTVLLGCEKETLVLLVQSWFTETNLPVVSLRGYSSQSYEREIQEYVEALGRPAVCIYAGDHDPSGEDISRNFFEKCPGIEQRRIALNRDQAEEYDLPILPGKATDPRANGFIEKYGDLVQVEVEALDPNILRSLYEDAIEGFFDKSTFEGVLAREIEERAALSTGSEGFGGCDIY